jgi:N-acetyl-anhydromuramyl-L-alanine amidase AmpD
VAYPFVESPHVTRTGGRRIDLIVVHTMEADERPDAAERCAEWFRQPSSRVSAHYCVDADSIVQCVRDEDVAWAAPGANRNGLQVEHAGWAAQTRREWDDAYSRAMLARSARLVADLCLRYRLPPVWVDPAGLRAARRGLTTHHAVGLAFGRTTHRDPGPGFPFARYLELVRALAPQATVRRGDAGPVVARLQRLLQAHGAADLAAADLAVDGVFGPRTEAAVRAFQRRHGLEADGVVGPRTWRALLDSRPIPEYRSPIRAFPEQGGSG